MHTHARCEERCTRPWQLQKWPCHHYLRRQEQQNNHKTFLSSMWNGAVSHGIMHNRQSLCRKMSPNRLRRDVTCHKQFRFHRPTPSSNTVRLAGYQVMMWQCKSGACFELGDASSGLGPCTEAASVDTTSPSNVFRKHRAGLGTSLPENLFGSCCVIHVGDRLVGVPKARTTQHVSNLCTSSALLLWATCKLCFKKPYREDFFFEIC